MSGELEPISDENLCVWYGPQQIRDHYDGDDTPEAEWVASASDEALRAVGEGALNDDRTWKTFHEVLQSGVREEAGIADE